MSSLAQSMLSKLIPAAAILLSAISQAGLPGHVLQFFQYGLAFRFRKEAVYEKHFTRNKSLESLRGISKTFKRRDS